MRAIMHRLPQNLHPFCQWARWGVAWQQAVLQSRTPSARGPGSARHGRMLTLLPAVAPLPRAEREEGTRQFGFGPCLVEGCAWLRAVHSRVQAYGWTLEDVA
eukprot:366241-Chlamydomonas_euryale.AAC.4